MAISNQYGNGSVSQRKDGTWTARIQLGVGSDGKRKVKAFYGKTEREVRKKLKDYREELAAFGYKEAKSGTVEMLLNDWMKNVKKNSLKPRSYDRLEQVIDYMILPRVGHMQIASFDSNSMQGLINRLVDDQYAWSSIKKVYDSMNSCYKNAVITKKVVSNPCVGVVVPKSTLFEKEEIQYYAEDQVRLLYEAAHTLYSNGKPMFPLGDVVVVAVNTGMRSAEIIGLRWENVDLDNKMIEVKETVVKVRDRSDDAQRTYKTITQSSGKTLNSTRHIPINSVCYDALMRLKTITGNHEYVFATRKGTPLDSRNLYRMVRGIERVAGFPDEEQYGIHALRHTFATLMIKKGVDIKTVSTLLGHADVTLTLNTYVHVTEDQRVSALTAIDLF